VRPSGCLESERPPRVVDEDLLELGLGHPGLGEQCLDAGEQVVVPKAAVVFVTVLKPDVLPEQDLVQVPLGDLGGELRRTGGPRSAQLTVMPVVTGPLVNHPS